MNKEWVPKQKPKMSFMQKAYCHQMGIKAVHNKHLQIAKAKASVKSVEQEVKPSV